jgi:hypothetical protein
MLAILRRSLIIRGFANVEIRYREQIAEGLEAAPGAFIETVP